MLDAIKELVNVKGFAIAGCFVALAVALPPSVSASYEFWYGYISGGLAAICDLHMNGMISTNTVKEFNKNFLVTINDQSPAAATRDAVKVIRQQKDFKNCPIRQY